PAVPGWAVLPARLLPRAPGDPCVSPLPDPWQGLLRDQGRARLSPPRELRPARLRQPCRLAAGRSAGGGRDPRLRADRLADRTPLRTLWRGPWAGRRGRRRRRGQDLPDALLQPARHRLVGARPRPQRPPARSPGAEP